MTAGVYLIRAENGLVKIGQTADVSRRLQGLQAVSPMQLSLIHIIETDRALVVERMLHDQFATSRQSGEWFALSEADVASIQGFVPSFSEALPLRSEPMTPQQLKAWREERKLTQAQLAKELEVSLGTVRKYEQGERKIPAFMWRALRDLAADLDRHPAQGEAPDAK